ncbi:MAG: type II and III secretion system protein family protein [Isosphaeraceae bacterium]
MPNFRSRRDAGDRLLPPWPHLILAALVIAAWPDDPLRAQVPPPPAPAPPQPAPLASQPLPVAAPLETQPLPVAPRFSEESEIPATLPRVPLAPPRPVQGPRSVGSFVESLRGNDATFEVLVNQARILTLPKEQDITAGPAQPLIAVGDPSIVEFAVVSPRQLRVTGFRIGATDLSITTARNETYTFEIHVVADLTLIQGKLRSTFPDASIKLSQLRDHIVVEGEARDQAQITRIIETINAYLTSVIAQSSRVVGGRQGPGMGGPAGGQAPGAGGGQTPPPPPVPAQPGAEAPENQNPAAAATLSPELSGMTQVSGAIAPHQIINLLRVAGSQQVMLKVRIAELNRTAMRRIGANFLGVDRRTGAIVGSSIAGPTNYQGTIGQPGNLLFGNQLFGSASLGPNDGNSTVFGIFQHSDFEFSLTALRQNGLLKILAEPNLVALNGQLASFLAGGEFPVPVPQVSASGVAPTITVRFREFGVRLGFVPYILDGDVIRLTVAPEVSNIDPTIAVTLVAGGTPVPGLNTRKAQTTVELREGQTLAIAGLLQLTLSGQTNRIPGLGDLPIIGPFFSNTSSGRIEKELVVLVTPYLVEPMSHGQVPPTPGDEVKEPNDLEFFFLNRIEARTGKDFRATTAWDDIYNLRNHLKLEKKYVNGPVGFSE